MNVDNSLEGLPNIGPALAAELHLAGIETAAQLRLIGARAAWTKVKDVNPERDCASSLLALEGALRGVRWMSLDRAEREALSAYAAEHRGQ